MIKMPLVWAISWNILVAGVSGALVAGLSYWLTNSFTGSALLYFTLLFAIVAISHTFALRRIPARLSELAARVLSAGLAIFLVVAVFSVITIVLFWGLIIADPITMAFAIGAVVYSQIAVIPINRAKILSRDDTRV